MRDANAVSRRDDASLIYPVERYNPVVRDANAVSRRDAASLRDVVRPTCKITGPLSLSFVFSLVHERGLKKEIVPSSGP